MKNPRYLGTNAATILLGVTARDFGTGEPLAADPKVRETPWALQVMAELEQSADPQFIGGAGFWLARDGALLWNRGYADWDYSPLAKNLLARARVLEPTRLDWFYANPELPKAGEQRGLGQIRIGGSVIAAKNVRMVKPDVPPDLRAVKGNVSLDVAVGLDGHVLKAIPLKGPAALYEISVKAVEQWVYQPTTINGTPVIVLTAVDVKYE
jgi:hypothetical protein